MCEYCGCQAIGSIEELTREHDAALEDIRSGREAAATGDGRAAEAVARRLLELLGPHTAVEEQALFPAMAREHPEHVATLTAEHRDVHAVLIDIASGGPAAQDWQPRLLVALHVLREHIAKEQDGLFPAALTSLGRDDWEAVEQIRARVGSTLRPAAVPAREDRPALLTADRPA